MVHDGTEDGVLKPESCWDLDIGGAPKVCDVVPRDRVEPLEFYDFLISAGGLLAAKQVGSSLSELAMRGRKISESAAWRQPPPLMHSA